MSRVHPFSSQKHNPYLRVFRKKCKEDILHIGEDLAISCSCMLPSFSYTKVIGIGKF